MTPAAYKGGAEGVLIHYVIIDSAQGPVLIAGTAQGVCAVLLGEDEDLLVRELHEELPNAIFHEECSERWEAAVLCCQSEDPSLAKLPLSLRGRIFQAKVWSACLAKR
jgi:AraC family transcriptional regulator of adaptative response/methylated-DNA-[protein]-cysteine methyltransferase